MHRFNFIDRIRKLFAARKENEELRDQIKELARFRNQLLYIVLTTDEINHVNIENESLFVTLKQEKERISIQGFDHDLLRIASVELNIQGRYWNLIKEEISPGLSLSFKIALRQRIDNEAKRKNCILLIE